MLLETMKEKEQRITIKQLHDTIRHLNETIAEGRQLDELCKTYREKTEDLQNRVDSQTDQLVSTNRLVDEWRDQFNALSAKHTTVLGENARYSTRLSDIVKSLETADLTLAEYRDKTIELQNRIDEAIDHLERGRPACGAIDALNGIE